MSEGKKSHARPRVAEKKPYRTPTLTVHGDLGALTKGKAGTKGDGSGKPATRTNGGQA